MITDVEASLSVFGGSLCSMQMTKLIRRRQSSLESLFSVVVFIS